MSSELAYSYCSMCGVKLDGLDGEDLFIDDTGICFCGDYAGRNNCKQYINDVEKFAVKQYGESNIHAINRALSTDNFPDGKAYMIGIGVKEIEDYLFEVTFYSISESILDKIMENMGE